MKLPVIVSEFTVVGVLRNTPGVEVTPNTIYVIVCPVKYLSKSDENVLLSKQLLDQLSLWGSWGHLFL